MPKVILFHKPYGVLSQFTDESGRPTLAQFQFPEGFYAAGRLDQDSEGLLVLTNNGQLQAKLTHPKFEKEKVYWVQVEGIPTVEAIERLKSGVQLKDGLTKKAKCRILLPEEVNVFPRTPPIRVRLSVPETWIELIITEGKNRQVRRMTAAVGYPTLRLIRKKIGPFDLASLALGEWCYQEIF